MAVVISDTQNIKNCDILFPSKVNSNLNVADATGEMSFDFFISKVPNSRNQLRIKSENSAKRPAFKSHQKQIATDHKKADIFDFLDDEESVTLTNRDIVDSHSFCFNSLSSVIKTVDVCEKNEKLSNIQNKIKSNESCFSELSKRESNCPKCRKISSGSDNISETLSSSVDDTSPDSGYGDSPPDENVLHNCIQTSHMNWNFSECDTGELFEHARKTSVSNKVNDDAKLSFIHSSEQNCSFLDIQQSIQQQCNCSLDNSIKNSPLNPNENESESMLELLSALSIQNTENNVQENLLCEEPSFSDDEINLTVNLNDCIKTKAQLGLDKESRTEISKESSQPTAFPDCIFIDQTMMKNHATGQKPLAKKIQSKLFKALSLTTKHNSISLQKADNLKYQLYKNLFYQKLNTAIFQDESTLNSMSFPAPSCFLSNQTIQRYPK